jgi:predicted DCC family thiol-disulfide oxidoreductase YuxK
MPTFSQIHVARPPAQRPLMLYDGDCNFCRRWIARWRQLTGEAVDYEPYQQAADRFPEIPVNAFQGAVQLILTTGEVYSGAEAVFRALSHAGRRRWVLCAYHHIPGVAPVSESFYRLVARHRGAFSKLTTAGYGSHLEPSTYHLPRWLFLRVLGVVYLAAFVSLWTQVDGLLGSDGILPAEQYLLAAKNQLGSRSYWKLPTLCWLSSSDTSLHVLCGSGTVAALLLVLGIAPLPCLAVLWVLYLSLVSVGQVFLGYQWDNLLLETGLLAIFFAPGRLVDRLPGSTAASMSRVPRLPLWLLRWLLFRLMFCAGVVKLSSGDSTWRKLTALTYHYETQPIPSWISWYAHNLPVALHRASAAGMFFIELVLPFAIFLPRRFRIAGAAGMAGLQLLIGLTGNYGFFNLLSIALCLLLLDDAFFGSRWRQRLARGAAATSPLPSLPRGGKGGSSRREWLAAPLAAVVLLITGLQTAVTLGLRLSLRGSAVGRGVAAVYETADPLRSINPYGLFAVMTTRRPEIIVEGSNDGATWKAYAFPYKAGDPARRPPIVVLHMPRLDWQMWFAALRPPPPWFYDFAYRLLHGSKPVLALLEHNPFPNAPPRYLRTRVYDYRFTRPRTGTADWWRREPLAPYAPILTLDADGELAAVLPAAP